MFEPGKSGNPGGRTKKDIEVETHARLYAKRAIDVAVEVMEDTEAFKGDRLRAAQFIVERAYGKPHQQITATVRDVRQLSDSELIAILQEEGGEGVAESACDPKQLN